MRTSIFAAMAAVAALAALPVNAEPLATQPSSPPSASNKSAMSQLFKMPGLVTYESERTLFTVSDRVSGWLLRDKEVVKSVSPGTGPVTEDYKLYSRVGVYAVTGTQGRWLVTMYQCNSRNIAMDVAKSFFVLNSLRAAPNLVWNGERIGDMSAGHHVDGTPDKPWQNAVFVRGNVAVAIYSEPVEGEYCDPRRVAAIIDSYLTREPKVEEGDNDRDVTPMAVRVVGARGGSDGHIVVGEKCVLEGASLPAKDGTVPPIIRSRSVDTAAAATKPGHLVSELQIRGTHASVARSPGGGLEVTFSAPGKQEVRCYLIDSKGSVVAFGCAEVVVEKGVAESGKSKEDGGGE